MVMVVVGLTLWKVFPMLTRRVCMTLRREGTCDGNGNSGVDPGGKGFQCRSVFAGRVGERVP